MNEKPNNLYDYLELIRLRPAMYIGSNSLSALYFHIGGYTSYCINNEIDEKLNPDFHKFHDFVANYFQWSESTTGWKNIILSENSGNEEMALTDFYKLFDLFRKGVKI